MEETTTREKVLKKIRAALLSKSDNPYPRIDHDTSVYAASDEDPLLIFSEKMIILAEVIARCGFILHPFLPKTAPKMVYFPL